MFALVDCNNFYASCERVFAPELNNRPIVILSNNDGCVIARSNEAKALGVPMGAPFYQYKELFTKHNVKVFSSNFSLYGDFSQRVMSILESFAYPVEIYSIDEAFIELPPLENDALTAIAQEIRKRVGKWTGIPISLGIAPTKTLAKIANKHAKKEKELGGVCTITPEDPLLETFPVGDIWGIGNKRAELLNRRGICTAAELAKLDDRWIRKQMSVMGLRTVWELRGTPCVEESDDLCKSIVCSRSFSNPITSLEEMKRAIATFAARAATKLRRQEAKAAVIGTFLRTSPFRTPFYSNSACATAPVATSYTPEIIRVAHQCLSKIFREGLEYKKGGIFLEEISLSSTTQTDLFSPLPSPKRDELMLLIDSINHKQGAKTLFFGAEGKRASWKKPSLQCSAHFTTHWDDLLTIDIDRPF